MPPAGFEPTISAGEQQQTYALDREATGIGFLKEYFVLIRNKFKDGIKRPGGIRFVLQNVAEKT